MRKLFSFTALIITVCSLVALAAVFSFTRTVDQDICTAVEEQSEKIERVNGNMLWESLSNQFVSSVHR